MASLRRSDKERHRRGDVTLDPHPFDEQLGLHEIGRHVLLRRRRLKARVCPAVVLREELRHAAQVVQHADLTSTTLRHAGMTHAAQIVQHADLSSTTLRHAGVAHAAQAVQHADLVQRLRVPRRGHLLQQRHPLCSALLLEVLRGRVGGEDGTCHA